MRDISRSVALIFTVSFDSGTNPFWQRFVERGFFLCPIISFVSRSPFSREAFLSWRHHVLP